MNIYDISKRELKSKEIKIKQDYVNDFKYDEKWIYIPRIYAYDYQKVKFRILENGKDKVKNCLKITWNPDRYNKNDIVKMINDISHLIKYHVNGTCQNFLRIKEIEALLTVYDRRNKILPEVSQEIREANAINIRN